MLHSSFLKFYTYREYAYFSFYCFVSYTPFYVSQAFLLYRLHVTYIFSFYFNNYVLNAYKNCIHYCHSAIDILYNFMTEESFLGSAKNFRHVNNNFQPWFITTRCDRRCRITGNPYSHVIMSTVFRCLIMQTDPRRQI